MPTDVVMPQMGESIFEGTITKWLKKPGDRVQRDEPLFEISTDKVDAEIPSPAAGVLGEIKVQEGATVQVNTVVATIAGEGEAPATQPAEPAKTAAATGGGAATTNGGAQPSAPAAQKPSASTPQKSEPSVREAPAPPAREETAEEEGEEPGGDGRVRTSPLVRKMAREHNLDLSQVSGTGMGGRITKQDVEAFLARRSAQPARAATPSPQPAAPAQRAPSPAPAAPPQLGEVQVPGEVVPMTPMRKKIAERMVESKRTSAHVHSVFDIDVTRIMRLREKEKARFEQLNGVKLTVMPFFARAIVNSIRQQPIVNTSVEGENIRYHRHVNLGIAVALDWGLIVPVVKNAEQLNFLGLQRAITDLADRARSKKLKPDDVQGGTFTITNPGIFGPLFGTPIILQPQTAILGMGGIFKMPVVRTDDEGNDAIVIRQIIKVSLGYDHRIIDGADADKFLLSLKKYLESWDEQI